MYVNGSCWLEPLCRHLVCYLQNLEQKQTTSRVFVDLFCSKLFSKGALILCCVPNLSACMGDVLTQPLSRGVSSAG